MEMCWEENPESRPDFQNLCGILSEIPGCEKMTEVRHNPVKFYRLSVDSANSDSFKSNSALNQSK